MSHTSSSLFCLGKPKRLGDKSLFHPSEWDQGKTFQENWVCDQRRFLQLAAERTGNRYEITESGEWIKTEVPDAPRKVMSDRDWRFYTRQYYANEELYAQIGPELLDLPPGEVSPKAIGRGRSPGRANRVGASSAPRRNAA